MRILFIGDIVGEAGVAFVRKHLKSVKKLKNIDFCIANGENTAGGKGINRGSANELFDCGVDVITLGNHAFNKNDVYDLFDEDYPIIRPANYPVGTAGNGYILMDKEDYTIGVINLCGRIFMETLDCPFRMADSILSKIKDKANIILIDFHAEVTSEKLAIANYLDGRVSAVVGTHTHVQTADEKVFPKGTAFISDVGMTGPINSILGVKTNIIVDKFITQIPARFELADGDIELNTVIINIDENTGKSTGIERLNIK